MSAPGRPRWQLPALGLVVLVVAVLCFRTGPAGREPPSGRTVGWAHSPAVVAGSKKVTSQPPGTVPSVAALNAPELQILRAGLEEWLRACGSNARAPGYDKESQDKLQNNLLELITRNNAAAVLQSLLPDEMDSPVAIAATQRWLEADPSSAARWIASCPFATDDQAWAVAHSAVADGALLNELCAGPARQWKERFLHYAAGELEDIDSGAAGLP